MSKLTDETLMLYADGLLSPSDEDRVNRLISQEPELRARLKAFRLTGRQLAHLLQDHVNTPVPDRLRDLLLEQEPARAIGVNAPRGRSQQRKSWLQMLRLTEIRRFETALVASIAMIGGLGLGWLLRGDTASNATALSELIQIEGKRLIARGRLQQALEKVPSDQKLTLAFSDDKKIELNVKMTFQNGARNYCREYEISMPSTERYVGVACRIDADWVVEIQAMTAPRFSISDRTIPASGGNSLAIDAAVSALVEGDPLTDKDEDAVIRNRWKR